MPRLEPPANGVTVRMYRPGHGDCFLLAFSSRTTGSKEPAYVLIDCGYKPGSQNFVHGRSMEDTVSHIGEATGYHLDLVIVTHEHQDHVNGFWKEANPYFESFTVERAWFAWTEDTLDPMANRLRAKHRDQLLGLVEARRQLALAAVSGENPAARRLDALLGLEFGMEGNDLDSLFAAATAPERSVNKQAMKLIRDKARGRKGVRYLGPGDLLPVADGGTGATTGAQVFVLGPPRDENLLADEDPVGREAFSDAHRLSFVAAAGSEPPHRKPPFGRRHCLPLETASGDTFFHQHYGSGENGAEDTDLAEVPASAPWRRIDADWLYRAEDLALKLNAGINNTSLVLAFELPQSKKVLFFPGDAQRGNWLSWAGLTWRDGDATVSARDLLGRTVLYKVGHHGSHNATLSGQPDDDYANLSWMAHGRFASEFTAMIPAVNEWALTKNTPPPWRHPLPSIKRALEEKAQGRVFQTDENMPPKPDRVSDADWEQFLSRSSFEELYFDFSVLDE